MVKLLQLPYKKLTLIDVRTYFMLKESWYNYKPEKLNHTVQMRLKFKTTIFMRIYFRYGLIRFF